MHTGRRRPGPFWSRDPPIRGRAAHPTGVAVRQRTTHPEEGLTPACELDSFCRHLPVPSFWPCPPQPRSRRTARSTLRPPRQLPASIWRPSPRPTARPSASLRGSTTATHCPTCCASRVHAHAWPTTPAALRASRRVIGDWSTPRLRTHARRLRASVSELRRTGGAPDVPIPAALHAIAQCESGGNPAAVSSSGSYRGLFQFDYGTWASVGGSGDPAAAPAAEQYRRAAMLYARSGASPWPVCGR